MQIAINTDQRELKLHGNYNFPVYVSFEVLSQYESGSFLWHWHPEIELTLVLKGEMDYQINETLYHIREGEGLFGNGNTLHTGHMHNASDCTYISTTFHPRALYGYDSSLIHEKYVETILKDSRLSSLHFTRNVPWHAEILDDLSSLYQLSCEKPPVWEMRMQMLLYHIWILICENHNPAPNSNVSSQVKNIERLKSILSFIHSHYAEKITLENIASSAGLCRSECCRFFKKHMNESLFDYLLSYRIEQSLPLLLDTDHTVTEVSGLSGFSNPCYYTKIFKKQMGISPTEYRKVKSNDSFI